MSAIVEDNNTQIDPGAEVRRLQDLVQKLERQNQVLRSKQSSSSTSPRETNDNVISSKLGSFADDNVSKSLRTCDSETDNVTDSLKKCTLEDVDIVDIDRLTDDEESW